MRYHWICDKFGLDEFVIEWEPGVTNLADYFTKNLTMCIIRINTPTIC